MSTYLLSPYVTCSFISSSFFSLFCYIDTFIVFYSQGHLASSFSLRVSIEFSGLTIILQYEQMNMSQC